MQIDIINSKKNCHKKYKGKIRKIIDKQIEKFYEIKDVSYVKPIVYVGVDNQYILGFASMIDNNLYLYDLDSSGIIVLNDTAIVADKVDDNAYYIYDENYLVIKTEITSFVKENTCLIYVCSWKVNC